MIDILQKNRDNTIDCVQLEEIKVGDEFPFGFDQNNRPMYAHVTEIHEQRKERGTYLDESRRRNWAKISWKYNP